MVSKLKCMCRDMDEVTISSVSILDEVEFFFNEQIDNGVFEEIKPNIPYYTYQNVKWFADKWYRCKLCGCLWEYNKPDFPAYGFVRKFIDGIYIERGY